MSEEFNYIRDLLRTNTGIYLENDKVYLVESRINTIARKEGFSDYKELVRHLRRASGETPLLRRIIETLMTNETFFFREMPTFDAIREKILPDLMKKRLAQKTLNIMSNACSTGQEPYSLAMLLDTHFPALGDWNVMIMATDYSRQNLEKAKSGSYQKNEVNRGVPDYYKSRYFTDVDGHCQIKENMRKKITFQELNLKETWGALPKMDLILLRNVLIYFDATSKQEILARVERIIQPDGYLVLGSSETTIGIATNFKRTPAGSTYVYRLERAVRDESISA